MKKKGWIILVAVLVAVILIVSSVSSTYNKFVAAEENVRTKQSTVSTYLQRRADLIPNFVASVKGYTDYEQETLTAVTEARSKVGSANTVGEQQQAGEQLDKAISIWVNAVTEAYPDLKASAQYIALQDELAGSENRIATARKDYNDAAQSYNVSVRRFPGSIIAGLFGFEKAEYFTADENAQNVPQVSFE